MEYLNFNWFNQINASESISNYHLWFGIFAAKYLVFFIVLWLSILWMLGNSKNRYTLMLTFSASIFALLINWGISLIWFHPRPFVLGIGHTYLAHAPDSSFPSDHFTALCAICFVYLWQESFKCMSSIVLILSSLLVAWARIYLGVHFPFDMLGGAIVSLFSASVIIYMSPQIYKYLFPLSEYLHKITFVKLFQKKYQVKE